MDFNYSAKTLELQKRLSTFMDKYIYPNEQNVQNEIDSGDRWQPLDLIETLKEKAKAEGCGTCFCLKFPD